MIFLWKEVANGNDQSLIALWSRKRRMKTTMKKYLIITWRIRHLTDVTKCLNEKSRWQHLMSMLNTYKSSTNVIIVKKNLEKRATTIRTRSLTIAVPSPFIATKKAVTSDSNA